MGKLSCTNPTRVAASLVRALLCATLVLRLVISPPVRSQTQPAHVPLILPSALVFDAAGDLYFAETANHVIRMYSAAGVLSTVAGNGTQGFSGDNGPATSATLDSPQGVALDAAGNLYLADTHNHRIRRVAAGTGIITTIAGKGTPGFSGDNGAAVAAALDLPTALALDSGGNLYFADTLNHRIRRVAASTGVITTVAGNGIQGFSGDNGVATSASIDSPLGLAVDMAGNVYFSDTHNARVRRISAATGVIATVAGSGAPGFSGDNGQASSAALALPRGVTLDAAGNVYFADSANHRVRQISAAGVISTIAGQGTEAFLGDEAPAVSASLDSPRAVALSPAGLVTLTDTANQRIRIVDQVAAPGPDIHTYPYTVATVASDFALSPTGATTQSIPSGSAASYGFAVQMKGNPLSSPINLAVQGLPLGAVPTLSPPLLPPGGAVTAFTLSVLTPKAALTPPAGFPRSSRAQPTLAILLLSGLVFLRRPHRALRGRAARRLLFFRLLSALLLLGGAASITGCGNRILFDPESAAGTTYTITVTGTATGSTGGQIQHSANVTLQVL